MNAARVFITGAIMMIVSVRCDSKDMAALAVLCFAYFTACSLIELVDPSPKRELKEGQPESKPVGPANRKEKSFLGE